MSAEMGGEGGVEEGCVRAGRDSPEELDRVEGGEGDVRWRVRVVWAAFGWGVRMQVLCLPLGERDRRTRHLARVGALWGLEALRSWVQLE